MFDIERDKELKLDISGVVRSMGSWLRSLSVFESLSVSECHLHAMSASGLGVIANYLVDSVRQGVRILLPLAFPASLSFLVYKSQSLVLEQELLVGVAS